VCLLSNVCFWPVSFLISGKSHFAHFAGCELEEAPGMMYLLPLFCRARASLDPHLIWRRRAAIHHSRTGRRESRPGSITSAAAPPGPSTSLTHFSLHLCFFIWSPRTAVSQKLNYFLEEKMRPRQLQNISTSADPV